MLLEDLLSFTGSWRGEGLLCRLFAVQRSSDRALLEELGEETSARTTAHQGEPLGDPTALRRLLQEDVGSFKESMSSKRLRL